METSEGFSRLILSWSLEDVVNNDLYIDKVRQIPKTFLSVAHYLKSFTFPLIEETRTDLCSSMKMLSEAPVYEITDIAFSENYKPPQDLLYQIEMKTVVDSDRKGDICEPEIGQLFTLTNTRPECIDDLNKHGNSYLIGLIGKVRKKKDEEDVYEVQILASNPIKLEMYWQEDGRYLYGIYGFAAYLINITTNRRIWNALNSDPEGPDIHVIKQLLQPDPAVGGNCAQCFSSERCTIDVSNIGAVIRSFDLNKAQEEGVLSCLAARECSHKIIVKLIWGPQGQGKQKQKQTLTGAPTNVAVLEVTSRFLRLVMDSIDYHTYGLGDIVLFGNRKRMSIDDQDDLLDIFLDYRVNILASCCTWQAKLGITRKECLKILKSLVNIFVLPDFTDEYSIKSFCLRRSRMLFCTAASSARLHAVEHCRLEMLVIDEAAQLKECESNIPLQLPGLRHVVLIGDEKQLPALVKSEISSKAGFGRSLFERLVLLGHEKQLLNIQYRMHPSISLFPNMEFYDKQILDSPRVKERSYEKHFLCGDMFKFYSFINVTYGQDELDEGNSRKNRVEVAVVSEIVFELYKDSRTRTVSVGVISPYKAQVIAIQDAIGKRIGSDVDHNFSVKVCTADDVQGGEEDVIIISTVRYNNMGFVGFISNLPRTNVALTRARYCLWIVGNGETLMNSGSIWERIVLGARSRGCYHNADEDDRLSHAITTSIIDLGQVGDLLHLSSPLFRKARWKVCFNQSFLISMARIKSTEICQKICSLLRQFSSGWRQPKREINLGVVDDISSQLLELYKVNESLYLVWTVDVIKENSNYVQILKIWDVFPLSEVTNLARNIDISYRSYSVDILRCCKTRCYDGHEKGVRDVLSVTLHAEYF
ncbi:regulator of nonsense transcripts 1 [Vigna unguiculata]|uniref:Regulator of nonsense transcripts 1 n=1 Tax=Vigna unguiculata TaxID=3917 RepID=A0A4D6LUL1_VIGUN|nr:regulator of nonsense transcripts 1 [Vigna unguiculata]